MSIIQTIPNPNMNYFLPPPRHAWILYANFKKSYLYDLLQSDEYSTYKGFVVLPFNCIQQQFASIGAKIVFKVLHKESKH